MLDPMMIDVLRKLTEAIDLLRIVVANNARAENELEPVSVDGDHYNWTNTKFLDTYLDDIELGPGYTVRLRQMCKYSRFRINEMSAPFQLQTVRDLVQLSEAQILREPNIGKACLQRYKAMLAPHGLHFGMRFPPVRVVA
jgi:hypothetical protein